jgi:hypothetical protein
MLRVTLDIPRLILVKLAKRTKTAKIKDQKSVFE